MASTNVCLVHLTVLLLIYLHPKPCVSKTETLILPLKTQTLAVADDDYAVYPEATATTKKLSVKFRHNVSLTVSLKVGSPPQAVTMVLDTGSELSWLHCKKTPGFSSTFDPLASSSYSPVPCSSPTCQLKTRDFPVPASCDKKKLCHVTLTYADLSSAEGNLATDSILIGGLSRPGFVFGCMDSVSSSSNSQEDASSTGLMGMNLGSLSFVTQMGFPKFSYCISGLDSSGVLVLSDASFSGLQPLRYTPLVRVYDPLPYFDRLAYTVQLEGIRVGNKVLNLPKSAFIPDHTGAGQTLFDTGTQFTFLLGPVYTAVKNEFMQQTKRSLKLYDDPNFVFQGAMDLCYSVGSARPRLPTVSLMFSGAEMSVSDERLLYPVPGLSRGGDSVLCFTFGNSDLLGIEAFLIGHHHQQNVWMEFDLSKSRVGFAEAKCDIARESLGIAV